MSGPDAGEFVAGSGSDEMESLFPQDSRDDFYVQVAVVEDLQDSVEYCIDQNLAVHNWRVGYRTVDSDRILCGSRIADESHIANVGHIDLAGWDHHVFPKYSLEYIRYPLPGHKSHTYLLALVVGMV